MNKAYILYAIMLLLCNNHHFMKGMNNSNKSATIKSLEYYRSMYRDSKISKMGDQNLLGKIKTELASAIEAKNNDLVEQILKLNDPNPEEDLLSAEFLIKAIEAKNFSAARSLCRHGAEKNINKVDRFNVRPLTSAIKHFACDECGVLIDFYNAQVDYTVESPFTPGDNNHDTLLHYIVFVITRDGNDTPDNRAKYEFLKTKIDINKANQQGWTAPAMLEHFDQGGSTNLLGVNYNSVKNMSSFKGIAKKDEKNSKQSEPVENKKTDVPDSNKPPTKNVVDVAKDTSYSISALPVMLFAGLICSVTIIGYYAYQWHTNKNSHKEDQTYQAT